MMSRCGPIAARQRQRPAARRTGSDELARTRRIIAAFLRKIAATSFPHEAAACRAKAEGPPGQVRSRLA